MYNCYRVEESYGNFSIGDLVIARSTSMNFIIKWNRDDSYIQGIVEIRPTPVKLEFICNVPFESDIFDRVMHMLVGKAQIPVDAWEAMLLAFDGEEDLLFNLLND